VKGGNKKPMLQVNIIFISTTVVILFRFILFWGWNFSLPDEEIMIIVFSLAVALRFGEDKGKKVRDLLNKLLKKSQITNE